MLHFLTRFGSTMLHRFLDVGVAALCLTAALASSLELSAQESTSTRPVVGLREADASAVLLEGGEVVIAPGEDPQPLSVLIDGTTILAVGEKLEVPAGTERRKVDGRRIYAGLIDALHEVELPPSSTTEASGYWNGNVTPQERATRVVRQSHSNAEKLRSQGVTAQLLAPQGGVVKGASCVVLLLDPDHPQRLLRPDVFQHVTLTVPRGRARESYPNSPMGATALVRQSLYDALWYRDAIRAYERQPGLSRPEPNEALEVLAKVVDEGTFVFDAANERMLIRADAVAKEFSLQAILRGSGREYRALDEVVATGRALLLPVDFPEPPNTKTLTAIRDTPLREWMHWHLAPENPARLARAGATFCLTTDGLEDPSKFLKQIRQAVRRGLDPAVAHAAVTTTPAQLLGIETMVGEVRAGMLANLLITDGDLFAESTEVLETWIAGKRFTLQEDVVRQQDGLLGSWNVTLPSDAQPVPLTLTFKMKDKRLQGTLRRTGALSPADTADEPARDTPDADAEEGDAETSEAKMSGTGEIAPPQEDNSRADADEADSNEADSNEADSDKADPNEADSNEADPDKADPDKADPDKAQTGEADPGDVEKAETKKTAADEPSTPDAETDAPVAPEAAAEAPASEMAKEDATEEEASPEASADDAAKPAASATVVELEHLVRQRERLSASVELRALDDSFPRGVSRLTLVMVDDPKDAGGLPLIFATLTTPSGERQSLEVQRQDEPTGDADDSKPDEAKPDQADDEPQEAAGDEVSAADAIEVMYPLGAYGRDEPPAQRPLVLFRGATIWTCGPAGKLDSGDVLVREGKIAEVAEEIAPPPDCWIVDAQGKHLTPGLIDAHSHIATDGGVNESGQAVTAEVRIGDFIDNSDISIYRQLAGGVTTANILHGSANPIGGQSQTVKLRWGMPMQQMKFEGAPQGIKFALGENVKRASDRYPNTRMGVEQILRDQFLAARQYDADWKRWNAGQRDRLPPRRDLQLDALVEIQQGDRWVHCHSYRQDEIIATLDVLEEFNIQIGTLQHILEGYKVADRIAAHGAMASTFADWWAYKFEVYDAIPYNGTVMHDRGVVVSFNSDDAELARHLNTEAAKATKYGGVPEQEALKFVTLNPAKQLRIDDRVGSIEVGKDADLVLWSGRPLSTTTRCEQTWIDGREYFSLASDRELHERDQKLRSRLIQLASDPDASKESSPKPDQEARDQMAEEDRWLRIDIFCNAGSSRQGYQP